MAELVIELLRFIASQLDHLDPKLSSAILGIVVLGMVLYMWGLKISPPAPRPEPAAKADTSVPDGAKSIQADVKGLQDSIALREQQVPPFGSLEHIYFNTNGITNAIFVLTAAVLIFEYATLADRVQAMLSRQPAALIPKGVAAAVAVKVTESIEGEVALLMATMAGTVIICALLVMIGRVKNGRSFEIINRSFQLSLLVSVITFAAFALPLSFPSK